MTMVVVQNKVGGALPIVPRTGSALRTPAASKSPLSCSQQVVLHPAGRTAAGSPLVLDGERAAVKASNVKGRRSLKPYWK
jgi:hypothetical protein